MQQFFAFCSYFKSRPSNSFLLVTEEQKERMKKIVMAPDGEIPNSVVRIYFKPVIAVEVIRQVQQTTTSRESRSFFVELNKGRIFDVNKFSNSGIIFYVNKH